METKFRRWLKDHRYSLSRFALQMGLSRSHTQMVASSLTMPSYKLAKRIEEFTSGEVTYTDFVNDMEELRLREAKAVTA